MTDTSSKYSDFEGLRERAVALRREGLSRRQIRDRLYIDNNDILNRLLQGEPAPEWTKRPRAKDGLRAKARELRLQGMTYDQIQVELGCSKGSISLWVRDLPKPPRRTTTEQAKLAYRLRWEHELAVRDIERQKTKAAAADEIGTLSDRELFFVGVALYWAEGTKDKPYDRRENVTFVNQRPWGDRGLPGMAQAARSGPGAYLLPADDSRDSRCGDSQALLGRADRRRCLRLPEDDPQETQSEDGSEEHR